MIGKYVRIIKAEPHPYRFLLSRVLMKSGLSHLLTVRRGQIRLRFYPSPTTAQAWIDPEYVRDEDAFIRRFLRAGDVVVDCGANIGLLSLPAARIVGEGGIVYAIEAHPRIFEYLSGNTKLNNLNNVKLFNVALAEKEGTVKFSDDRWDELNSVVTTGENGRIMEIQSKRLDDLGKAY